MDSEMENL